MVQASGPRSGIGSNLASHITLLKMAKFFGVKNGHQSKFSRGVNAKRQLADLVTPIFMLTVAGRVVHGSGLDPSLLVVDLAPLTH